MEDRKGRPGEKGRWGGRDAGAEGTPGRRKGGERQIHQWRSQKVDSSNFARAFDPPIANIADVITLHGREQQKKGRV